ncbi:excinuclease ABC subunit UvrC [bacterium]|jgi:excinuclease ABC subunit C|nr:excinuclease ABC subunit UvrC [bacterium]
MTPANIKNIPEKPGIYFFLNFKREIIYIGKAKNLKKRVTSYWRKTSELTTAKIQMIQEIHKIQYTIVDTETESLLLEAEQIKKHQPKYNIVLKDDKSWGYIVITDQPFPRIVVSHGRQKIKGQHFGPYTSTMAAKTIVRLLHRILPLRICRRDLSKLPKGKICLQYHLGSCDGPCEKLINSDDYQKIIQQAIKIIKGETKNLATNLLKQVKDHSDKQQFELATKKKNQLLALKRLQDKQKIISAQNINQDLVSLSVFQNKAVVTLMQVRRGVLGDKFNFVVDNKLNLKTNQIIESTLQQFYSHQSELAKEIISPVKISIKNILANTKITNIVPQKGKNKKLLKLLKQNAEDHLQKNIHNPKLDILNQLQNILDLKLLPSRIEVYDISNIQGEFSYGSMIVFIDGKIAADQYRIFKIKGIEGPNDVESLKQVLARRQKRSEWPEPDLIILDGGKPQLNTVFPVLNKAWQKKIISLAKKQEEIFIPGKKASLKLKKDDKISLFIQNMRDQAHKFGIKHYRKAHRKNLLK